MPSIGKKIATEQEAYSIGGKGTPVTNKMVTEVRAEALGCKILGDRTQTGNKLVVKVNLAKTSISLGKLTKRKGSLTISRTGTEWYWDLEWEHPANDGGALHSFEMELVYGSGSALVKKITVGTSDTSAHGSDSNPLASGDGTTHFYILGNVIPADGYSFS